MRFVHNVRNGVCPSVDQHKCHMQQNLFPLTLSLTVKRGAGGAWPPKTLYRFTGPLSCRYLEIFVI